MALKVSLAHPDFPKGTEMEVMGIGLIKVGSSVTLTETQEKDFMAANDGLTVREALKDNEMFKVEGATELKPVEVKEVRTSLPITEEGEE